jgi:hypothetical protein
MSRWWWKGDGNMRPTLSSLPLLLVLALAGPAPAAVDLVTLPTREGTQLTIYNSEDITMVREHRLLTVKEGVNRNRNAKASGRGITRSARLAPLASTAQITEPQRFHFLGIAV